MKEGMMKEYGMGSFVLQNIFSRNLVIRHPLLPNKSRIRQSYVDKNIDDKGDGDSST